MRTTKILATLLLVAFLSISPSAEAEFFRWLAFGDSITNGSFDTPNFRGYPPRLEDLLGCTPSTCEVFKSAVGGERTVEGLTRLDGVLDNEGPFQVAIFMEGTNDLHRNPPLSVNTVRNNLNAMASKARLRGTEAVHASIIWFHPDGNRGTTRDDEIEDLRNLLATLSASQNRSFFDTWNLLCPDGPDIHGHSHDACFNHHYFGGVPSPDPVGHPKASGYTMIANYYHGEITSVPTPGPPTPAYPTGTITVLDPNYTWNREIPVRSSWYQLQVTGPSGTILDDWYESIFRCTASSCTVAWFGNLPGGAYQWRVRGRNTRGFGTWTPWTPFVIDTGWVFNDDFESGGTTAWSETVP